MRLTVDMRALQSGLERLERRMGREATDDVVRAMREGGLIVQGKAVRSMRSTPKTGRRYKRGAAAHTASSPGNPPAIDTGFLASSVEVRPTPSGADVGSRAQYAKWLEFGTRHIAPRPFLAPALRDSVDEIVERVRAALRRRG